MSIPLTYHVFPCNRLQKNCFHDSSHQPRKYLTNFVWLSGCSHAPNSEFCDYKFNTALSESGLCLENTDCSFHSLITKAFDFQEFNYLISWFTIINKNIETPPFSNLIS